jgi:tRNA U34 2-thiouridine synthase MnmA/TrmU
MAKALLLFSGGLDSIVAAKILQEQGIELIGLNFYSPFFGNRNAIESSKQLGIPLIAFELGKDYVKVVKKPKYGYGASANPCKDCKIFMLKKAKKLMKKLNADFIATGEVLGERPMSQHKGALVDIEKDSGLKGKLLRPLSAKLLDETEIEKSGIVDREKLLDIEGRVRKRQIAIAEKYNLSYPVPSGGCLLCEKEFARKLKDLFKNKEEKVDNVKLLKIGRHFRYKGRKIIVGRDKKENDRLSNEKGIKLEPADDVPGPTTLIKKGNKEVIRKAAELTAYHSDPKEPIDIIYGKKKLNKSIFVILPKKDEVENLRI